MAASGREQTSKEKLLTGLDVHPKTFKNHLDGYNQLNMLTKPDGKSNRHEFSSNTYISLPSTSFSYIL